MSLRISLAKQPRLRGFIVSAALLFLASSGVLLQAYAYLGHKWASSDVLYYVNPHNIYMSDTTTIAAIQNAANAWSYQASANIRLVYAGTTNGGSFTMNNKNEVFFRSDASAGGVTYWWSDGYGNLVDADIAFNQGGFAFTADGLECSNALNVQDIATHEFGHVLGLQHSTITDATMYPYMAGYCDTSWRSLSSDDIVAIQGLYPGGGGSAPKPPSAPSSLSVAPDGQSPTSSLDLTWRDGSSNENGFRIERSANGSSFAVLNQVPANVTSYVDTNLAAGTVYYYRVAAFNDGGDSTYSNVNSAQTSTVASLPAPPVGGLVLQVRAYKTRGLQKADLSWSGFTASHVDVYRNGSFRATVGNSGFYTDAINAKGSGSYTYQVCESGTSTCSSQVRITF